jgi:hypothetical protein
MRALKMRLSLRITSQFTPAYPTGQVGDSKKGSGGVSDVQSAETPPDPFFEFAASLRGATLRRASDCGKLRR